jgi:hypothetical protein
MHFSEEDTAAFFMLVSYFAYSSTLKMDATFSSKLRLIFSFFKSQQLLSHSRNSNHFMESEGSSECAKEAGTIL